MIWRVIILALFSEWGDWPPMAVVPIPAPETEKTGNGVPLREFGKCALGKVASVGPYLPGADQYG